MQMQMLLLRTQRRDPMLLRLVLLLCMLLLLLLLLLPQSLPAWGRMLTSHPLLLPADAALEGCRC